MTFIVNGERWCSLIEAVRRADGLCYSKYGASYGDAYGIGLVQGYLLSIAYAPDVTESDCRYYERLMSQVFQHLPWNGELYNEWTK